MSFEFGFIGYLYEKKLPANVICFANGRPRYRSPKSLPGGHSALQPRFQEDPKKADLLHTHCGLPYTAVGLGAALADAVATTATVATCHRGAPVAGPCRSSSSRIENREKL